MHGRWHSVLGGSQCDFYSGWCVSQGNLVFFYLNYYRIIYLNNCWHRCTVVTWVWFVPTLMNYLVSVSLGSGRVLKSSEKTVVSAHWDEKRASTGREQRAKCVISLDEACHFCTGGSPDMKRDRGRCQVWESCNCGFMWRCKTNM